MSKERAHSKFSASGADRWFSCPGSVKLSEGQPDKSSVWAEEGTKAHTALEMVLKALDPNVFGMNNPYIKQELSKYPLEMAQHALDAAYFIRGLEKKIPNSEVLVETRIYLSFIHPEMFGTFDGAVIDYFGTLHVFDYKYGAGHSVSPRENLQMIFYGIGLAEKYNWNFKKVRLWIIQPRIKGYDGPAFWEITIDELYKYVTYFEYAVKRVEKYPDRYVEGAWCWWCKAKAVCPLKIQAKIDSTIDIFKSKPLDNDDEDFY